VDSLRSELEAMRVPPQSIEAEQSVLGALLLANHAWDEIADVVREEDFYRANHRLIFRHIVQLIEENKPADPLTVSESLGEELADAGGRGYIGELFVNTPSAANARRYAQIVRDRAQLRRLITTCVDVGDRAYAAHGTPAGDLIAHAEQSLTALHRREAGKARSMSDVLTEVLEQLDTQYSKENPSDVTGLASGFVDLDAMTAGFQGGDLIIVAGRPSMGKTALAMNIVEYVALHLKRSAAVFSLEMSDKQLVQRMIGSVGHIDQHQLRTGKFPEEQWARITETTGKLAESRIFIEETYDLSPATMRAKARRLYREHPDLAVIVVDYLQLMEGDSERRVDQIAEISRGLKRIARELKIPVIALSQLNRSVEQRQDKRPMMSDLRESGALEQDADLILFLYRDEVYDSNSEAKGTAEVIIAKQRSGPIGMVRLTFQSRYARFDNYAGEPISSGRSRPRSKPFAMRERADIDG
jgi:replicative DNA helicase